MTMRSIEAKYEYEAECQAEIEILVHQLDEACAGAELDALVGALSILLVEAVRQVDDMPESEQHKLMMNTLAAAWIDYDHDISTMQ